jgi:hypothetical protein
VAQIPDRTDWLHVAGSATTPPDGSNVGDVIRWYRKREGLKEVMSRIGHGSTRAAMIYQHATSDRDRKIAEALNLMIEEARAAGEEAAE